MTDSHQPCALQIVHGYNEPFLSLTALYSRALRQQGWRVVTVYLTGEDNHDVMQKSCADDVLFFNTPSSAMRGLKLSLIWQIRTQLRQHNISLIIAQRYKSLYLGLLASIGLPIPVLGIAHAFGVLNNSSRQLLLRFFTNRLTLAGVSTAVTQDILQQTQGIHCVTLLNAIDTTTLELQLKSRATARALLGIADETFVFANVGRLHADKDQTTLIRAFSLIAHDYPAAQLLLIGQGKCEAKYRALIASLQLENRIALTGLLPDAATFFHAFDVYVSASDKEPFGIVLTEAMLAHLPVISTDCGGAPEVLGEHAHYFPSGDSVALAAHMTTLLNTTAEQRQQQGKLLHQRLCEHFSFSGFSDRLKQLLLSLQARSRC